MRTNATDALYIRAPRLNQLNVLNQLASDAHLTQAELARRCGLSVAMLNNYMKELCRMGLIEYRRKNAKSISYHITPAGREHLEKIQEELIDEMVNLFAEAKERIRNRILSHAPEMFRRVVLFGSGPLAELAFHALAVADVSVMGVCDDDPAMAGKEWCGREVINPSQIKYMAPDAVVIADHRRTAEICGRLGALSELGIALIRLDRDRAGAQTAKPVMSESGVS